MTFYVNKGSNNNLIITFDYSFERVKKIKQVTNRWNAQEKHWEMLGEKLIIHNLGKLIDFIKG